MTLSKFLIELRKKIGNQETWSWLLFAINQDIKLWEQFNKSEYLEEALEILGNDPKHWRPGSVSLLSLGDSKLHQEIINNPDYQLPAEIVESAVETYERWKNNPQLQLDIKEISLNALYLNELYRYSSDWRFLEEELVLCLPTTAWVVTCLFGLTDSPDKMLVGLAKQWAFNFKPNLFVHAVLSNPQSAQNVIEQLERVFAQIDNDTRLYLIREINVTRPDLAVRLRDTSPDYPTNKLPQGLIRNDGFNTVNDLLHQAYAAQILGDVDKSIDLFNQALSGTDALKASITAEIAKTTQLLKQITSDGKKESKNSIDQQGELSKELVRIWKKAVSIDPTNQKHTANLLFALIELGKYEEAQAILESLNVVQADQKLSDEKAVPDFSPEILIAQAIIANNFQSKNPQAKTLATEALEKLQNAANTRTDHDDDQLCTRLARFLAELELYEESIAAANLGLSQNPLNEQLLKIHAEANYRLARYFDTVASSITLLELLPDDARLRKIHTIALEGIGEWEHALDQRNEIFLEGTNDIINRLNQAYCAIKANLPGVAIQLCTELLNPSADDVYQQTESTNYYSDILWLLADAERHSGDEEQSLKLLQEALEHKNSSPQPWLALADLYSERGDTNIQEQILRKACQALPKSHELQFHLGKIYFHQDQLSTALTHFRIAVEVFEKENGEHHCDPDTDWQKLTWNRLIEQNELRAYLGRTLLALGHPEEAVEHFEIAIEKHNGKGGVDNSSIRDYAKSLMRVGDHQRAIPYLEHVAYAQPAEIEPAVDLARALSVSQVSPDQLSRAINLLENGILQYHSGSTLANDDKASHHLLEAQALLAELFYKNKDFPNAYRLFKQALSQPYSISTKWIARLSHGLGKSAIHLEEYETAITALQEATQHDLDNWQIYQDLSNAYLEFGLPEHAFHAAYVVYKRNTADLQVLSWFADQCAKIYTSSDGDHAQANSLSIQALERAASISPGNADVLKKLGAAQYKAGNLSAAKATFSHLASLTDLEAGDKVQAAKYLKVLGEGQQAIELLQGVIGQERKESNSINQGISGKALPTEGNEELGSTTKDPSLFAELADSYRNNGDIENALHVLDEGLSFFPGNDTLQFARISTLLDTGNQQFAINSIENLLIKDRDNADYHIQAAHIYLVSGEPVKAIQHTQTALNIDPDRSADVELQVKAAEIYYSLLQKNHALELLRESYPEDLDIEYHCLVAELTLDLELQERFSHALHIAKSQNSEHPWLLSLMVRDSVRREGVTKLQGSGSAEKYIRQMKANEPGSLLTAIAYHRTLIDMGNWDQAVQLLNEITKSHPKIPLVQFLFAESLVSLLVTKLVYKKLNIISHAPGDDLFAKTGHVNFADAINFLEEFFSGIDHTFAGNRDDIDKISDEIERLKLCGSALINPEQETIEKLIEYVKNHPEQPLDMLCLCLAQELITGNFEINLPNVTALKTNPIHIIVMALSATPNTYSIELKNLEDLPEVDYYQFSPPWLVDKPVILSALALAAHKNHDLRSAAKYLEQALEFWPEEARWQALLTELSLNQYDFDQKSTLAHIRSAIDLEPENPDHYSLLSRYYRLTGNFQAAIDIVNNLKPEILEKPRIWLDLAETYLEKGEGRKAESCIDKAIPLARRDTEALSSAMCILGEIALNQGKPREALDRAKTSIYLCDKNSRAYELMSRAYRNLNKPDRSIKAIENAIKFSDTPFVFEIQQLNLLSEYGNKSSVLEKSAALVKKYPHEPQLQANYAKILMENGQMKDAVRASRDALRISQSEISDELKAELHYIIGKKLHQDGQLDQAIHHLSNSINFNPKNIDSYIELGRVHKERREFKLADLKFQEAMKADDTDPRPYFESGILHKENNDFIQAEQMLRRAAELSPEDNNISRMLAAVVVLNLVHNRKPVSDHIDK